MSLSCLRPLQIYTALKPYLDNRKIITVWDPYKFTLLSNLGSGHFRRDRFETPTNLHCSQTYEQLRTPYILFETPTNLHCSQTFFQSRHKYLSFETPTNLHCSQTWFPRHHLPSGLRPLQIYTALKPVLCLKRARQGLRPLQIYTALKQKHCLKTRSLVWDPYKFTLLSNALSCLSKNSAFETPTNLHCSQTENMNVDRFRTFETPTNLHCSQTRRSLFLPTALFETPTNLHCSQTAPGYVTAADGLRPLQIYTALKRWRDRDHKRKVWDPYKFTLLSNASAGAMATPLVWDPYKFTLLSNYKTIISVYSKFETPTNLHCSQTYW